MNPVRPSFANLGAAAGRIILGDLSVEALERFAAEHRAVREQYGFTFACESAGLPTHLLAEEVAA